MNRPRREGRTVPIARDLRPSFGYPREQHWHWPHWHDTGTACTTGTGKGIIIVTGSNGRIGDAVMRRFAGRFDQVVGFDRKAPTTRRRRAACTFRSTSPPTTACEEGLSAIREHHGSQVASVVHLAAYYDFLGEPSPKYDEITVRGTGRMLRGLHELDFAGRAVHLLQHDARAPARRAGPVHR